MEYNNLHETANETTFTHYIAHDVRYLLPYNKRYYCIMPSAEISFIEVSVLADFWIVFGIVDLPESRLINTGHTLNIEPVNQNNKHSARTYMFKDTQIKGDINNQDFINQVYVNLYQQNKILVGLVSNHRYYIEVKNTMDKVVYYNLNIRFAQGSATDHENLSDSGK
ncbi:MAG: hypothetical protein RPT95_05850 [Candidatus Sedimenticola sp. (ex Thyasira tokunagai)]